MICLDLNEEEIRGTLKAVEDGIFTYEEAFNNIMLFQSKNKDD